MESERTKRRRINRKVNAILSEISVNTAAVHSSVVTSNLDAPIVVNIMTLE